MAVQSNTESGIFKNHYDCLKGILSRTAGHQWVVAATSASCPEDYEKIRKSLSKPTSDSKTETSINSEPENLSHREINDPKEKIISGQKIDDYLIIQNKSASMTNEEFRQEISKLKKLSADDKNYDKQLYLVSLGYEKVHNDYFRATCFCHLAHLHNTSNQYIKNDLARLKKILAKKMGKYWVEEVSNIRSIEEIKPTHNTLTEIRKVEIMKRKIESTDSNRLRSDCNRLMEKIHRDIPSDIKA